MWDMQLWTNMQPVTIVDHVHFGMTKHVTAQLKVAFILAQWNV